MYVPSWKKSTSKSGGYAWKRKSPEKVAYEQALKKDAEYHPLQAVMTGIKEGWNAPKDVKQSVSSLYTGGGKGPEEAVLSVKDTLGDSWKRLGEVKKVWTTDSTKADKAGKTGLAALGVVNTLFTPVTAGLKMFQEVPVIGNVAEGVERVFGAIGGVASILLILTL